jgi:tol-pal system protein YbgF
LRKDDATLRRLTFSSLLLAGSLAFGLQPAFAQKKDTLLLMRQLDTLQQSVQNIQRTVDTQTAVLKTLVEQANDNVNSMKLAMEELKKATQQNLASSNARLEAMTTQIQSLSESLEEAKARIAKLSEQVTQTQNIIQTLHAPPAVGGLSGVAGDARPANLPDAQTLYNSGLSSYTSGQYQLAMQAFQEYLQYYGDTDLASNAQFYIGECYYSTGDYERAIQEYDKGMERYPSGNKLPAAQLKKGYALLALDRKQAGVQELRSLLRRYPNSREADLAKQRLKKLGVAVSAR